MQGGELGAAAGGEGLAYALGEDGAASGQAAGAAEDDGIEGGAELPLEAVEAGADELGVAGHAAGGGGGLEDAGDDAGDGGGKSGQPRRSARAGDGRGPAGVADAGPVVVGRALVAPPAHGFQATAPVRAQEDACRPGLNSDGGLLSTL